jgi:hypothetical protein
MKYVMLHSIPAAAFTGELGAEARQELDAWCDEMLARGVLLDGARLQPDSDATTVRRSDGQVVVTDGPFAETKEQIAGYDVVECDDLDSALAVAAAHPTTRVGHIEVRAFDAGMPEPEVPARPAEGTRRYLMLVCADMRRAMARDTPPAVDQASPDLWDPPEAPPSPDSPDSPDSGEDDVDRWIAEAAQRRIYGWALEPPHRAVTVRRMDGEVVTTDGPFAETKEQIAGFDLLECTDLDDAIEVAAGHPMADGGVLDLRPLLV